MAKPLRGREPAVQADQHTPGKALFDTRFELRREIDFGHHHKRLPAAAQGLFNGVQVHLGLATARHAVDQGRGGTSLRNDFQRCALLGRQLRRTGISVVG